MVISLGLFKVIKVINVSVEVSAVVRSRKQVFLQLKIITTENSQIIWMNSESDYEMGKGIISRRVFFTHLIDNAADNKEKLDINFQDNGKRDLKLKDVTADLMERENCMRRAQEIHTRLSESKQEINGDLMFSIIKESERETIFLLFFFVIAEAVFNLIGFVSFQALIHAVEPTEMDYNFPQLYMYACLTGIIWVIEKIHTNNYFYEGDLMSSRLRNILAMTIYIKISNLSEFVIKSNGVGTIKNLISSDLNILEFNLVIFFISFQVPLKIVGSLIIFWFWLGWMSCIVVLLMLVPIPLYFILGKLKATILKGANSEKDDRIKKYSEVVDGIKFIKMHGWELAFKDIIQRIRQKEIKSYVLIFFFTGLTTALSTVSVIFSGYIVFKYIDSGFSSILLSTAIIFSIMQPLINLRNPIVSVGTAFDFYYYVKVVLQRFSTIMRLKDIRMIPNEAGQAERDDSTRGRGGFVSIKKFNGFWNKDTPVLNDIDLEVNGRGFYGITGKVGCGKSSLLQAIMFQLPYFNGKIQVNGTIAYVEQEPVIFSETVRGNILNGKPFVSSRYDSALENSCLIFDLYLFPNGDETMLGENGATLSGGQRARLSLARALYSDADIYLLDDPISAVDAKVARFLFEKAIKKLALQKTVFLVTHQVSYLTLCDEIYIMEEGRLSKKQKTDLKEEVQEEVAMVKVNNDEIKKAIQKQIGSKKPEEKTVEEVKVELSSFCKYMFNSTPNYFLFPFTVILYISSELTLTVFFLAISEYDKIHNGVSNYFETVDSLWKSLGLLLLIYFSLLVFSFFFLSVTILLANQKLHSQMLINLVRAPMSFFDKTPSGFLTNKFSNDLNVMDTQFVTTMHDVIERFVAMTVNFMNIFILNVIFVFPGVVMGIVTIVFFHYCRQLIMTSQKLTAEQKNPLYHLISEAVNGITQITISGRKEEFILKFSLMARNALKAQVNFYLNARLFSAYTFYIMNLLQFFGLIFGLITLTKENASLFAVQIIYLLQIARASQFGFRQLINAESYLVNMERCYLLVKLQSEAELKTFYDEKEEIPEEDEEWPQKGYLSISNLSMRYSPEFPCVLNNLSLDMREGEKIGIVGRTGAGKSSIIQMLFRLVEPEEGCTYNFGGYDALQMGLHALRKHISVLPQNPFLFKGTIRMNLDPFGVKTEEQIYRSLREVGILDIIEKLPNKIDEYNDNIEEIFSVGNKQLMCLARTLLHKRKFLILDEATSNVDFETDRMIQDCIHTQFKEATVITIAHRLNTIADYDRLIVLDRGTIIEMGAPHQLILKKGIFYEMVQNTGKNAEVIKDIAKRAYKG